MKTKHDFALYLIIAIGLYLCHAELVAWLDRGLV